MKKLLLTAAAAFILGMPALASLQQTASALDETINDVETKIIVNGLAEKVGVEAKIAKDALLDKKLKLSQLALAKFVSEKSASELSTVLEHLPSDWQDYLKSSNVSEREAEEYLDALQTEVALLMLDYREHRQK